MTRAYSAAATLVLASTLGLAAQVFTPPQGRVDNTRFQRDPNRPNVMVITYDLISSDPTAIFRVDLEVSLNQGVTYDLKPVSVTGDIGPAVRPGRDKRIAWEFEKDTEQIQVDRFRFRVSAIAGELKPVTPPVGGVAPPPPPPPAQVESGGGGNKMKWILPVIGAGAVGAALAMRGGGSSDETTPPPPPATCTGFTISPTSFNAPGSGGSQSVSITGSSPAGCTGGNWNASNGSFFSVSSQSGSGNGSVTVNVQASTSVEPRTGSTSIASQTFSVSQAAGINCTYQFVPQSMDVFVTYIFGGGSGSTRGMDIRNVSNPACPWSASVNVPWLNLTPSSGTNNGTVILTTNQPNNTGSLRYGTLTMRGVTSTTPVVFTLCQIRAGDVGTGTACPAPPPASIRD